ncbi:ribosomal protein L7/L12 [Donghicola eburneus]|uniref:ribosomal protein L7/L12 n=1 Tax=Donghicola eburneus TaxID=393278 RepID=UPI001C430139|nr:ribosomal protein L7/L12 [Donghicola eburneus]
MMKKTTAAVLCSIALAAPLNAETKKEIQISDKVTVKFTAGKDTAADTQKVSKEEAEQIKAELEGAGAEVEVK